MEADVWAISRMPSIEPRIAVVGVGGAGCNIVNDIYWADPSLDTVAINTDKVSLRGASADKKVCLCRDVTRGEGTKGDIRLGENCAKAHSEEITDALIGHDAVFIIAGMGGGTGTGVTPVVADIAHSLNMMVFTIAVKPFSFETQRTRAAKEGIAKASAVCPMTIVIENDKVLKNAPDATMDEAFKMVNRGIVNFIKEKKKAMSESVTGCLAEIDTMIMDVDEHNNLPLSVLIDHPA
ncbi:MAG: cell division protein FtsZ [Methanomassiliicoccaceae archaeon]|nr:cell division protein FtsZ [Methanomassiliicoccaceae archaeon]